MSRRGGLIGGSGGSGGAGGGVTAGAYANLPNPATATVSLYEATDGGSFVRSAGVWYARLGTALGAIPPTANQFTKLNGTAGTLTDSAGTLVMSSGTGEEAFGLLGTTLNSTFQVDVAFRTMWNYSGTGNSMTGLWLSAGATAASALKRFSVYWNNGSTVLQLQQFPSIGGAAGTVSFTQAVTTNVSLTDYIWLRVTQDASNTKYWYSNNGRDYFNAYSEAKTTFLTPVHMGLYTGTSAGTIARISSFQVQ